MKPKKSRTVILILIVLTINLFFVYRLMQIQIVNRDQIIGQLNQGIETKQVIAASRGEIYDRNGVPLAVNKISLDVVINYAYMGQEIGDDAINTMLLKLIPIMEKANEAWIDTIPITKTLPFRFEEGKEYEASISKLKEACKVASYATVDDVIYHLKEMYALEKMSDCDFRTVVGVRYEMEQRGFSMRTPYVFATDIQMETLLTIKEHSFNLPGVDIEESSIRQYPNGDLMPHIIGSLGYIDPEQWNEAEKVASVDGQVAGVIDGRVYRMNDRIGKSGAELTFEDYLKGTDGERTVIRDSDGTALDVVENQPVVPGKSIYLAMDSSLQKVALDSLEKQIDILQNNLAVYPPGRGHEADSGAVAVVNVKTGETLVLASYPSYDLSTFQKEYSSLINDTRLPLYNRALAAYTPGSIFKPVVALGALTEGTMTRDMCVNCQMIYTRFPGYQPRCLGAHGATNVVSALRWSCNVYFYDVGYHLGIENLGKYATHLGLGEATGIEIPESIGRMSSVDLKAKLHTGDDANWYPGDILQASIGQLDSQFTPLQFANYTATLANNGKRMKVSILQSVKSYTLDETYSIHTPQVAEQFDSPEAFGIIHEGMVAASTIGTARATFGNYPIAVASKTGTPETILHPNSTFIAYAPADDPEIAVCVIIEKGWHGYTGAPVARAVFDAYFHVNDNKVDE